MKSRKETDRRKLWLNRGWQIQREIDALDRLLQEAEETKHRMTADAEQIKVQTSEKNQMEKAIQRSIEYETRIRSRKVYLVSVKDEVASAISKVEDGTCRMLLIMRYLEHKTWDEIATMLHYSWTGIHKVHRRALGMVDIPDYYRE